MLDHSLSSLQGCYSIFDRLCSYRQVIHDVKPITLVMQED